MRPSRYTLLLNPCRIQNSILTVEYMFPLAHGHTHRRITSKRLRVSLSCYVLASIEESEVRIVIEWNEQSRNGTGEESFEEYFSFPSGKSLDSAIQKAFGLCKERDRCGYYIKKRKRTRNRNRNLDRGVAFQFFPPLFFFFFFWVGIFLDKYIGGEKGGGWG